ncbi:Hypothetical predicted protein [Octopus vulgaris]|uniref:Uncharacterized protein n=1 Tax=Octopus vulgaris TaxID=6645 RepID=A0AA36B888_OCTVU|nr:Hypothetical predicted protein [Octopus vulgaris]
MIVADTTSLNTGKRNGIVNQLQRLFAQKSLKGLQFIGCQHHILDRVLRIVVNNLEKKSSPNIEYTFIPELLSNYEKLQANFNNGEEKITESAGWRDDMKFLFHLTRVFHFFEEVGEFPTVKFRKIPNLSHTRWNSRATLALLAVILLPEKRVLLFNVCRFIPYSCADFWFTDQMFNTHNYQKLCGSLQVHKKNFGVENHQNWKFSEQIKIAERGTKCLQDLYDVYLEESLRWLVTNGDFERSKKVIKRAAKENGVDFGPIWDKIETNLIPLITVKNKDSMISSKEKLSQQQEVKKEGYLTIFTNSLARRMTLILFVVGINQLAENIEETLNERINRCAAYSLALDESTDVSDIVQLVLFVGGVTDNFEITEEFWDVANGSSVYSILNIIFSLLGMFGISASFCLIWIYAPEIYPTNLRNIGLGFLTFSGSVGNMVSPYSRLLMENIPWLPGTVCSIGCILSFSLLYFMPESQKMQMPSSMSDVKAHMKLQKRSKREKSGKEIGSTDTEKSTSSELSKINT